LGGTVCLFEQFLTYTLWRIVNFDATCYIVAFGIFFLRPYPLKYATRRAAWQLFRCGFGVV